jgi:predicted dinucleotide-binding enzyme
MRIGILGAGNVGGTLGRRWADLGHDVAFGVRHPEAGAAAVKGGQGLPARARVATPADAVRGTGAVVLATPWAAAPDMLRAAGADKGGLDGLPLLDTTNALKAGFTVDTGPNGESAGERVQALVPNAHVVKVFNTTGFNNMRDAVYDGAPTAMFYAGDDASAKRVVRELVVALGFDPVDTGALIRARELEYLASLWIGLAYGTAGAPAIGRDFAFRLVRR